MFCTNNCFYDSADAVSVQMDSKKKDCIVSEGNTVEGFLKIRIELTSIPQRLLLQLNVKNWISLFPQENHVLFLMNNVSNFQVFSRSSLSGTHIYFYLAIRRLCRFRSLKNSSNYAL